MTRENWDKVNAGKRGIHYCIAIHMIMHILIIYI